MCVTEEKPTNRIQNSDTAGKPEAWTMPEAEDRRRELIRYAAHNKEVQNGEDKARPLDLTTRSSSVRRRNAKMGDTEDFTANGRETVKT